MLKDRFKFFIFCLSIQVTLVSCHVEPMSDFVTPQSMLFHDSTTQILVELSNKEIFSKRDSILINHIQSLMNAREFTNVIELSKWYLRLAEEQNSTTANIVLRQYEAALDKLPFDNESKRELINLQGRLLFRFQLNDRLDSLAKDFEFLTKKDSNLSSIAQSKFISGLADSRNGRESMAFDNFLSALSQFKVDEEEVLISECLQHISDLLFRLEDYPNALKYKKNQLDLLKQFDKIDKRFFLSQNIPLALIETQMGKKNEAILTYHSILDSCQNNNFNGLMAFVFKFIRSDFIEKGWNNELKEMYDRYPHQREAFLKSNTFACRRLKSIFFMASELRDSTKLYMQSLWNEIKESKDLYRKVIFAKRYAHYLNKEIQIEEAIDISKVGIQLSESNIGLSIHTKVDSVMFLRTIQDLSFICEQGFLKNKDFEQAVYYLSKGRDCILLLDSIKSANYEILNQWYVSEARFEDIQLRLEKRHLVHFSILAAVSPLALLLLIVLKIIKVPQGFVKIAGFVSFIFIFESVVLLLEQLTHHLTHDIPWRILVLKCIIVILLYPIHHYCEKRIISFLLSHKLLIVRSRR